MGRHEDPSRASRHPHWHDQINTLEKDRANNVSKPRSGRPRKLTEEQRDHIYNRIAADPRVKIRTSIDEIDGAVQKRSIQCILMRWMAGRGYRRIDRKTVIMLQ